MVGKLIAFVFICNRFVGINATDINVAAGRYSPGQEPPLETGLEVCLLLKVKSMQCALGSLPSGVFIDCNH